MKDLILILPEIYLLITLVGILLSEIGYHGEKFRLVKLTALVGLCGSLVQVLLTYPYTPSAALNQTLAVDGLALFFKALFLLIAIQAVWVVSFSKEIKEDQKSEYCAFVVGATLAMSIAASSSHLLIGFLVLQMLQMCFYFLEAFGKKSLIAVEASLKHWIFSTVGAVFFLFGIILLMCWTGAGTLIEIRQALAAAPLSHPLGWIVFLLVFFAFSFQIGVFPMYFWVPDVLEGAPTPVSAFISIGTVAATLSFVIRFLLNVFIQPTLELEQWQVMGGIAWPGFLASISCVSLIIGPLLAIRQVGMKRLCASLLISESGFFLFGILALNQTGIVAILYNVLIELFSIMGIFCVLSFFKDVFGSDRLSHLRGVFKSAVPECLAILLFLACLVGLPPFPGFIGKFALIGVAVQKEWYGLALAGTVSMALAVGVFAKFAYGLVGDFYFSGHIPVAIQAGDDSFLQHCLCHLFYWDYLLIMFFTWQSSL